MLLEVEREIHAGRTLTVLTRHQLASIGIESEAIESISTQRRELRKDYPYQILWQPLKQYFGGLLQPFEHQLSSEQGSHEQFGELKWGSSTIAREGCAILLLRQRPFAKENTR